MTRRHLRHTAPRGLTLVELMLALTITVMISGGIAAMMTAVSTGVGSKRDSRSVMLHAHAAQTRLSAYVVPANCILDAGIDGFTLWFNDRRESDSVHATEIRWIDFDADAGALCVAFVVFPDSWTQTQKDLADLEYPIGTDWEMVRRKYELDGHLRMMCLVDGLDSVTISLDQPTPLASTLVELDLSFATNNGVQNVHTAPSIRLHEPPAY